MFSLLSRALPYIVIVLLTILLSLSLFLHTRITKIKELESTVHQYEFVIENNNNAITQMRDDLTYTENLLKTLQEQQESVSQEHSDVRLEWDRVRNESVRNERASNDKQDDKESSDSGIDLSEHFRVLKESACRTNRDCL